MSALENNRLVTGNQYSKQAARSIIYEKPLATGCRPRTDKNSFMTEAVEAKSVTTLNKVYVLNETQNPVSFYTVIGDIGQTASTDVMLIGANEKKTDLYVDFSGNVPVTVIGTNETLKGSRLFISFAVNAVSAISNYCEGLVVVSGGDTPATHLLYETVRTHGELSLLTCIIRFH